MNAIGTLIVLGIVFRDAILLAMRAPSAAAPARCTVSSKGMGSYRYLRRIAPPISLTILAR
jgi:hypothetical protein